MNKLGRRVGEVLTAGALVGTTVSSCSHGINLNYFKPNIVCAGTEIKLTSDAAAARTKAIASAVLSCYNRLAKGPYAAVDEGNHISVSFPVAGGAVDFNVLSDAPVDGNPAAYIEHARDVSVLTYQVASAKQNSWLDGAGINTSGAGPLYMWKTEKGEDDRRQEIASGVQDDTGIPYLAADMGYDSASSFDPKVMACAEGAITKDIVDIFQAVTSQPEPQTLGRIPMPPFHGNCDQQV